MQKLKRIRLLKNIEKYLHDLGGKQISQIECKKHQTERTDNLDFLKYKNLGSSKDITKQMKKQSTDWERYLHFIYLTMDLSPEHKGTPASQ